MSSTRLSMRNSRRYLRTSRVEGLLGVPRLISKIPVFKMGTNYEFFEYTSRNFGIRIMRIYQSFFSIQQSTFTFQPIPNTQYSLPLSQIENLNSPIEIYQVPCPLSPVPFSLFLSPLQTQIFYEHSRKSSLPDYRIWSCRIYC